MKRLRYSIIFVLFLGLAVNVSAQRKKVGLVLSGGGAKGVAHIGVLQVLEKAGIPVDVIVGTSMGSIVGGLYAIGYTADQLDSLVRAQDWMFLLSDKVNRYDLSFSEKEYDAKYVLSFLFERGRRRPVGFIRGQNVYNLFTDLTIGHHDSLDFLKLPIPFACVAADVLNRQEVVMTDGNLVRAMRASMAIPGAFTPVMAGDRVLVDGGVLNNFPTDVARALGAEIVIGVDVQADLMAEDKLESVSGVIPQIVNLLCMNKHEENVKLADLVIRPNVKGYSAASFSARAIDSLLTRGKVAALQDWGEIMRVKELIGGRNEKVAEQPAVYLPEEFDIRDIRVEGLTTKQEGWVRRKMRLRENSAVTLADIHREVAMLYGTKAFSAVSYRLLGKPPYDLVLELQAQPMSAVNVGFRFDTEEMAAILLNTTLNYKALRGSQVALTGRLSQNPYVKIEYSLENTFLRRFNLAYMFRYNDVNYYHKGEKMNNVTYRYHFGELGLSSLYFRNFKFQVGLRYEYFDYNSLLFANEEEIIDVRPEGFFSYYGLAQLDTYDRRFYPNRGISFLASYSIYTDNMGTYDGGAPFSALSLNFTPVIAVSDRLKMLPAVYGRVLIGNNPAYSYLNCMGGTVFGRYAAQQIPFLGINHVGVFENSLLVGRLELRQRAGRKHYFSLVGNYAMQDDSFFDIFGRKGIWGGGVGYSRDSYLGPIDLMFSLSDWNKKLEFYFNLGFYF
ncbi:MULTISPECIES: patatin-like phospholipase family protein [Butyricimonas]|uniref:patatin-like phospholipase family protein n=1 Tax=Butyricimonas TaxID=574697 RepID=UPI001D065338|nr:MULTISPECIES: patatin-like phospholipase family protein [Butyricimonas]MCB6974815.1 patatin-like phospholipase family protein [Butyricimonas synergistica]MCG4521557.1 patatin-like phospholipase family protein [Butyricimonas sp. DFI.6.44]